MGSGSSGLPTLGELRSCLLCRPLLRLLPSLSSLPSRLLTWHWEAPKLFLGSHMGESRVLPLLAGTESQAAEHNPDGHALLRGHAMGEGGGRADFSAPNPNTQLQPLNPGPPGPRCAMLSSVCPDMAAAPSSPACSASLRPGPGRLEASLCTQILSATPIPIPDTCTYSGTLFHALVSPLVCWLQCCLGCRWAMKRASTPWKIKKSPHGSDTQDCKPQV